MGYNGYYEVLSDKDLGFSYKFFEINKGKIGLLLEKVGFVNLCELYC